MSVLRNPRRLAIMGALLLCAGVAAFATAWLSTGSAEAARAELPPPATPVIDGVVQISPAVQTKIDDLNDQLDACLTGAGAKRVPFGERGWAYQDPDGSAGAACTSEQAAVDSYANSEEMAAAALAAGPAAQRYGECLERLGVGVVVHEITPRAQVLAAERTLTA